MNLTGKRVVIIATDYFEESELFEPMTQLRANGAEVVVAAPRTGTLRSLRHVETGHEVEAINITQVSADEFDGMVLPGGVVNADHLRVNQKAQELVKNMMDAGKPVAAICHAPWLLVSAGLVRGKTLTSYPTLKDDIVNAGGHWVDEEVTVDGNLITSRRPGDLPAFIQALSNALN